MQLNTPAPRENIAVNCVNIFYPVLFASCVEKVSVLREGTCVEEKKRKKRTSEMGAHEWWSARLCSGISMLCLLPKLPPYT